MDIRKTVAALASLVLLIPLCGCSGVESDKYDGMRNADCQAIDDGVWQCTVTMLDTRTVTCLVPLPKAGGGIDCDWVHASGNDLM